MTIAIKVKKTLATARSVQASFDLFSYQTKDQLAKELFSEGAIQLDTTIQALENRLRQITSEEPQYKNDH